MIQDIVKRLDPLPPKSKLIIFGGGFSGQRIASVGRHLGIKVLCSRRKENSKGADFIFNTETKISNEIFEGTTHILSCIPPLLNGQDPVLIKLKTQLLKKTSSTRILLFNAQRLIIITTKSVLKIVSTKKLNVRYV